MNSKLIEFIQDTYKTTGVIPLHAPRFDGNELAYVAATIQSSFVSSVGTFVSDFEQRIESYTQAVKAVATVNGTAALHLALHQAGVIRGDLVLTQALTFVATCNAIHQLGAAPLFIDVAKISLGLCPVAVEEYLLQHAHLTERGCVHNDTGQVIRAMVPMHTFGHPVQLDELAQICQKWHICLIEDAAESLGSFYKQQHTGTIGLFGVLSFNGNKIVTTGGGGMLLCATSALGQHAKHISTTAKQPHAYEFYHDEAAFNYRMPNLNAALGCAQMESLPSFLQQKRNLAQQYLDLFKNTDYQGVSEPDYAHSNYWLNAVICPNLQTRNQLLETTNQLGIMTRPVWQLMHTLPMYCASLRGPLPNSEWLAARLVNLPSSPVGSVNEKP